MDHSLSDPSVRTADPDILIGTAETAHRVTFKVSQDNQGIIICKIFSHRHLGKPFSALYREHRRSVLIQDIHRAECPAIDL